MRFAYADPPYIGQARKHYAKEAAARGAVAQEVNHSLLIGTLVEHYPDGWALSCSSPSLRQLLPLCPADVRVMAWVKPFCVFKKGVRPAYGWEPVLLWRGRNRNHQPPLKGGDATTPKDFTICNITLRKGFVGAKPPAFCAWVLDCLGFREGDEVIDIFPGTGVMDRTVDAYGRQTRMFGSTA